MADSVVSSVASTATEAALELASLRAIVAELAATDLGVERALALEPFVDRVALDAQRARFEEARRLLLGGPLVPSMEAALRPILRALANDAAGLEGRGLVVVADLLAATGRLLERLLAESDGSADGSAEGSAGDETDEAESAESDSEVPSFRSPALAETVVDLAPLDALRELLRRTFDARGEIRENATPRLAALRGKIRASRQSLYDQLGGLLETHRDNLAEDTIPMRGGRLVMMLRSGSRGRVPGLVHGRSGTGRSLYFEPLEAVEPNNRLQQAVEEEEAEKRRILAEVLAKMRADLPAILAHADLLASVDLLQASVRLAEAMDGRLADIGERHEIRLVAARHPLLDPSLADLRRAALGTPGHTGAVVPLELEMHPDRRALVLTGPNAGGKTVTLKTLGLLALAHQCALPLPVAIGTRLPVFSRVVATVGDEQDLLADRSTFSGRLLRLREAWDAASPDALVLLDELGSGTDPEEGAALATALLEGLLERRSAVLVTTHLAQLAAAALEAEGAICAAMQFDSSTGEPTYRLLPGPPGSSEALALAHRLGLPREWLDRAEALLGEDHRDMRRLLAEIEEHRAEALATQERAAAELRDAERLRERLEASEAALREEKDALSKKLSAQLETFRRETRDRLRAEVETLTAAVASGRRKGLAAEATERLFQSAPKIEVEAPAEVPLEVGGGVRHRRLGWTGMLEKLERGRAQVRTQGKVFVCKEKELQGVAPGDMPKSGPKKPRLADRAAMVAARERAGRASTFGASLARRASTQTASPATTSAPKELMLIGKRVQEALGELDRTLDRALLASATELRVVHGHGSGRLKAAVREHLSGHRAVSAHRPGGESEGGDGATIVELAG